MKHWTLFILSAMILGASCEKDNQDMNPGEEAVYIQDNLFGCDEFEVMETEATFSVNVEPFLEVFHQFFVYEDNDNLVIKDGFNGPTLQNYDMQVDDLEIFNDQLMICAEEGLFRLNAAGELDTITGQRCYSMTLDGQNRLMLQGVFGNPGLSTAYDIYEFKNNTIVPFAGIPGFFQCISVTLQGGDGGWLYAISCDNEIAAYENGVVRAELDDGLAPLFTNTAELILHEYYEGGLIVIVPEVSSTGRTYRMYKLLGEQWLPLYDMDYDNSGSIKGKEVFLYKDYNTLLHNGYLYAFNTSGAREGEGINRFRVSGNEEKGWEDIDLIQIPGLNSREIVDIVVVSDGSAYAVLRTNRIVKISCG